MTAWNDSPSKDLLDKKSADFALEFIQKIVHIFIDVLTNMYTCVHTQTPCSVWSIEVEQMRRLQVRILRTYSYDYRFVIHVVCCSYMLKMNCFPIG
jgi:hypothetical protein